MSLIAAAFAKLRTGGEGSRVHSNASPALMDMITAPDLLLGLQIVICVIVVIVLYHVLFIVVDLRKVLRRIDDITEQVEAMILKPISLADQILGKVMEMIEGSTGNKAKKKKGKQEKVIDG